MLKKNKMKRKKKQTKKKTIPDWALVSKDEFGKIYEDVNNYIKMDGIQK